jgi:hypothetical protein
MKLPDETKLLKDLESKALDLHEAIGALITKHSAKFDWKVIEIIDSASFQALSVQRQLKKAYDKKNRGDQTNEVP